MCSAASRARGIARLLPLLPLLLLLLLLPCSLLRPLRRTSITAGRRYYVGGVW